MASSQVDQRLFESCSPIARFRGPEPICRTRLGPPKSALRGQHRGRRLRLTNLGPAMDDTSYPQTNQRCQFGAESNNLSALESPTQFLPGGKIRGLPRREACGRNKGRPPTTLTRDFGPASAASGRTESSDFGPNRHFGQLSGTPTVIVAPSASKGHPHMFAAMMG